VTTKNLSANPTVTVSPALVLARASSTSVITEWDTAKVLAAPAKFCKDLLHAMRTWKANREMPEQTMRDMRKAGGLFGRNPNGETKKAWTLANAKVARATAQYATAVDLLSSIPNLNGITIGKISDVTTERELTARDLLDGLTLPPSQSEIAKWLADAA
jgi:hypothetical protein